MTISPLLGTCPLSTITMSPGRMPAPDMESPDTLSRKVASRFWMRSSSRDRVSTSSSSAGLGNPASTVPRTRTEDAIDTGMSLPFLSRSRTLSCSSLLMSLETAFFERRPAISPISEKHGLCSERHRPITACETFEIPLCYNEQIMRQNVPGNSGGNHEILCGGGPGGGFFFFGGGLAREEKRAGEGAR